MRPAMTTATRLAAAAGLALALAACGTPKAARNVTEDAGNNAVRLAINLDRVDVSNRRATEAREQAIQRLAEVLAYRRSLFDDELARYRKAGFKTLIDDYEAWLRDAKTKIPLSGGRPPAGADTSDARTPPAPLPSAATVGALRGVGQRLILFSAEDGIADRVRFLVGFFKRVKADIDAAREAAAEAADRVEADTSGAGS